MPSSEKMVLVRFLGGCDDLVFSILTVRRLPQRDSSFRPIVGVRSCKRLLSALTRSRVNLQ